MDFWRRKFISYTPFIRVLISYVVSIFRVEDSSIGLVVTILQEVYFVIL